MGFDVSEYFIFKSKQTHTENVDGKEGRWYSWSFLVSNISKLIIINSLIESNYYIAIEKFNYYILLEKILIIHIL